MKYFLMLIFTALIMFTNHVVVNANYNNKIGYLYFGDEAEIFKRNCEIVKIKAVKRKVEFVPLYFKCTSKIFLNISSDGLKNTFKWSILIESIFGSQSYIHKSFYEKAGVRYMITAVITGSGTITDFHAYKGKTD